MTEWYEVEPDFEDEATATARVNMEFTCNHENAELRRRVIKGGGIQFVKQCIRCGRTVGGPVLKHLAVGMNLPEYNHDLQKSFNDARYAALQEIQRKKNAAWWESYSEYLLTPEWKERRRKVIARCKGVCEGCADAPATEVHHLSYAHVGRELLFELVGLCDACHQVAHDDKEGHT